MKLRPFCLVCIVCFACSTAAFATASPPKPFISAAELQKLIKQGNLKILDVRPQKAYDKGHIQGALQVYKEDYNAPQPALPNSLPSHEQFDALMSRLGILPTDYVVLYDNPVALDAAKLMWIMEVFGNSNTSILNGGVNAWRAAGYDLCLGLEIVEPSKYVSSGPDIDKVASIDYMLNLPDDVVLLDARSEAEYLGSRIEQGALRAGHIPRAVNLEGVFVIDRQSMHILPEEALRALFGRLGITADTNLVVYCHSGIKSTLPALIAKRVLGVTNVRTYEGAWVEWSSDTNLPITSPSNSRGK